MTIAVALKVGDGLVFGADSASTLRGPNKGVHNVYFSIEGGKISSSKKPEPAPLSPESAKKLKDAVRRIQDQR